MALERLVKQVGRMAKIGFWRFDLAERRVFWSPEAYAIYGLHTDYEPDFEHVLSFYSKSQAMVLKQAVERAIAQGEPYDLELDFVSADGKNKRVRTMAEPEYQGDKVVALVGVMQDITERYRMEEELREAATTDELTGLPNRRHLQLCYEGGRFDGDRPQERSFALALIDLDRFKSVNDELGHACGDAVLQIVAKRLRADWLANCFVARLGGDEFVLMITDPNLLRDLRSVCGRLLQELAEPVGWRGRTLNIGATFGMVEIDRAGVSLSDALSAADTALYAAKERGRGSATLCSMDDLFMGDEHREQNRWNIRAA